VGQSWDSRTGSPAFPSGPERYWLVRRTCPIAGISSSYRASRGLGSCLRIPVAVLRNPGAHRGFRRSKGSVGQSLGPSSAPSSGREAIMSRVRSRLGTRIHVSDGHARFTDFMWPIFETLYSSRLSNQHSAPLPALVGTQGTTTASRPTTWKATSYPPCSAGIERLGSMLVIGARLPRRLRSVSLLGILIAAGAASIASAVYASVGPMTVTISGSRAYVRYNVYRVPNARSCMAAVARTTYKYGPTGWVAERGRPFGANTCHTRVPGSSRTFGSLLATVTLRSGSYRGYEVCVTATQALRTGGVNRHTRCSRAFR
jgi:hypothetical protein